MRSLLLVHGVVTVAAGVVLIVLPPVIPGTVGIGIGPDAFLLCYLLAAAELAVGFLSLGARALTDPAALRLVLTTFVVFHGATAILELYAMASAGFHSVLAANVVLRIVVVAVFGFLAVRSPRTRPRSPVGTRR